MANHSETYPLSIKTPIEEYTHGPSGSVVDLVSTCHVGSPVYFGRLVHHLETRASEGFVVLEEGIRETSSDELDQASIAAKLKHRLMLVGVEYAGRAVDGVENSARFTNQSDYMEDLGNQAEFLTTVNVDVTELDVARASSIYGLAQRVRSSRALSRRLEKARIGGPLAYEVAIYNEIADQFRESEAKQKVKSQKADLAVVDERNEAVLKHIDKLCEQNEVAKAAVLWGYGHRRGLADGLESRDFRCTKVTSIVVAYNPSPFL